MDASSSPMKFDGGGNATSLNVEGISPPLYSTSLNNSNGSEKPLQEATDLCKAFRQGHMIENGVLPFHISVT
ncbi:unnamed protein product [Toxocara canis]|uniref:Ovule protein n=1 Tax=Toxocara canis TaxID=6265 RepID=A0A183UX09_TOXCA|nr:unnamed protein product [Toxocara canis]